MRNLTNNLDRRSMRVSSNNLDTYRSSSSKPVITVTNKNTHGINTNDENSSTWLEGNLKESPTKKQKMSNGRSAGDKGRVFGDEIEGNLGWEQSLLDISVDTKDTAISGLTHDDHHSNPETAVSDCVTDTSGNSNTNVNGGNFGHLRGLLDDFGKQNKHHFEKNSSVPAIDELDRPLRPKVGKSKSITHVTVPMASSCIKKHNSSLSTGHDSSKSIAPSFPRSKPILSHSTILRNASIPKSSSSDSGSTASKPRFPVRATPIRVKPKVKAEDVQATNEGYASVAQLSAWLADDPTSTKKVKQIRRGANVIAKSRKFDKELVNVIVEKSSIPRGGVSKQRGIIETFLAEENGDDIERENDFDDMNNGTAVGNTDVQRTATDWMRLGAPGSDIGICVSDKKKWLSSAFKKELDNNDDQCVSHLKKAATEIITNRDRDDDLSNRAKTLWRSKNTPVRDSGTNTVRYNGRGISATPPPPSFSSNGRFKEHLDQQVQSSLHSASSETISTRSSIQSNEIGIHVPKSEYSGSKFSRSERIEAAPSRQEQHHSRSPMRPENQYKVPVVEDTTSVDFAKAREQLVLRSKANGNPVDLSKVQRRKAKFEMMEKQARRMSGPTGLLKASWGEDNKTTTAESTKRYVKRYVEDVAPKKSFEDLP